MEKNTLIIIAFIGIVIFIGVLLYLAIHFDASMGALADLGLRLYCLFKIHFSPQRAIGTFFGFPDMPGGFAGCPN